MERWGRPRSLTGGDTRGISHSFRTRSRSYTFLPLREIESKVGTQIRGGPPFLLPHDTPPAAAAAAAADGEMASRIASRLLRRHGPTLGLLRSYTHVRNYSSQLSGLIPAGPQSSKLTRRHYYFPNASPYQLWSRSFASDSGEKFEAVVPFMGESVTDGTLATFLKKPGDRVEADEAIAQIETDKVTIDVSSPEAGVLEKYIASEGDTVTPGTIVAIVSKSEAPAETHVAPSEEAAPKESPPAKVEEKSPKVEAKAPKVEPPKKQAPKPTPSKTSPTEPQLPPKERERRVPMPRLRKRIANRLKDSQNTFAMLTTFNEVDMTNLMKLRSDYKDEFVKKHGVKLGLMSCFVKAAVSGLQNQPIVNAVIDGDDIIYRDYVDVSVAVGTSKGLVVPVIRDADTMNFADIEKGINNLAKKATEGALSIDEMAGGTFTISNGGVYGSLISTPIINPPQSAILGMHSIVQRPVVVDGNILARPMMYLALTYDHRLIDGREAVYFLRRIKDLVEDPRRFLLDI